MCKTKWNDGVIILKEFYDKRGYLLPLEFNDLPFIPVRMFYISNVTSGTVRGEHAHRKCKQIFICLDGHIILSTVNKTQCVNYSLSYGNAFYIPPMVWSWQEFYDGGTALVLASEEYDENDYIRDYQEFKNLIKDKE